MPDETKPKPKPKTIAEMTSTELEAHIEARETLHKAWTKTHKALAKAKKAEEDMTPPKSSGDSSD